MPHSSSRRPGSAALLRWLLLALLFPLLSACGIGSAASVPRPGPFAGSPITVGGLRLPARVIGPNVDLAIGGRFQPRFWAGVNLGSTVPGRRPGEVAGTRAIYDRWLAGMGALGARVVRIYTILRPAFYDALRAYDLAHPKSPLYLMQGIWIPEQQFLQTQNAYDPAVTQGFRAEIRDTVGVVHGDANLPLRPGHAGGLYRSDVSRWLLAYSPGVEWDPVATAGTDRKNRGRPAFRGRYLVASANATPMESWIASMLDYLAGLEIARGWSRPLTFTNWLTADPLRHPYEPLSREDMVSVDATHISATSRWPGGFFASYHAYPYYPDFLRRTPQYVTYRRKGDGKIDPYAGYLHALRLYHGKQAVMITEFGVPASLGIAHLGAAGRNQGNLSEQQAGAIDADLLRDIHDEGYAGGVLFEWIDEWFKFTWNTIDYQLPPDRRQLWFDDLTNEEHFGVIAAEPGKQPVVTVDGNDREWSTNGSQVIAESRGPVSEVRATRDAEYLYLLIRLKNAADWQNRSIAVGFHVRPGGNGGLPSAPGVDPQANIAVVVGPGERARMYQAAWTDPIAFQYGVRHHFIPVRLADLRIGSGAWVPPRLILNRPETIPATGQRTPVELANLGTLRWGTTEPQAPGFDERNLVMARGQVVEMRIPWELLTVSDPSSRQVYVPHPDGTVTSQQIDRIGIAVVTASRHLLQTRGYSWDTWNTVQWHERRKASWTAIKIAFAVYTGS